MDWTPERRTLYAERMRARHAARKAAGLPGYRLGQTHTAEAKAKMSATHRAQHVPGQFGPIGLPLTPQHEAKLRAGQKAWMAEHAPQNETHHNWKGDKAGYTAIHDWVKRRIVRTHVCAFCGRQTRWTDIANLDHRYRRELADYRELCRSCHRRWDKDHGLETPGGQKARLAAR